MRVWDKIEPSLLCRQHLLAEHRETLCIFYVITNPRPKRGYTNHPEVRCWRGHISALRKRHDLILQESKNRNYSFKDLPYHPYDNDEYPEPWDNQLEKLRIKNCNCKV